MRTKWQQRTQLETGHTTGNTASLPRETPEGAVVGMIVTLHGQSPRPLDADMVSNRSMPGTLPLTLGESILRN